MSPAALLATVTGRREPALALLIVLLLVLIGLRAPFFITFDSFEGVLTDTSILMMLAVAEMLVILTRGIDLSLAANVALTGMAMALLSQAHPDLPVIAYVVGAMLFGAGLGAFNGFFVAVVGLPSIVVTLGTLSMFRGLVFVLSGGAWVNKHEMSETYQTFPMDRFLGIPHLLWIAIIVIPLMWVFVQHTKAGRSLYAIGGDPQAARYVGVPVAARLFMAYAMGGLIAGLSGYLWTARFAVAYTEIAVGFELVVIAACVIGGVSIAGGVGTIPGAVLGALFLGVIANALPVMGWSPFWKQAISGAIILVAVVVNSRGERRKGKIIVRRAEEHPR